MRLEVYTIDHITEAEAAPAVISDVNCFCVRAHLARDYSCMHCPLSAHPDSSFHLYMHVYKHAPAAHPCMLCASHCHLPWLQLSAAPIAHQVIGPDVEYVLSRAQAIQQEQSSSVLTVQHLNSALENVQGGGGGGGGGDQLTKAELEATMKQMLMVRIRGYLEVNMFVWKVDISRRAAHCQQLIHRLASEGISLQHDSRAAMPLLCCTVHFALVAVARSLATAAAAAACPWLSAVVASTSSAAWQFLQAMLVATLKP